MVSGPSGHLLYTREATVYELESLNTCLFCMKNLVGWLENITTPTQFQTGNDVLYISNGDLNVTIPQPV